MNTEPVAGESFTDTPWSRLNRGERCVLNKHRTCGWSTELPNRDDGQRRLAELRPVRFVQPARGPVGYFRSEQNRLAAKLRRRSEPVVVHSGGA